LRRGNERRRSAGSWEVFFPEQPDRGHADSGQPFRGRRRGERQAMSRQGRTMRHLFVFCFSLAFAFAAEGQTLKIPPHQKITLKNGMNVLLMEKRGVPMVSFAAIVKAGSTADPAGLEGLASVTAELLRKGTTRRSAQKFAEDLDFIGASFAAEASTDFTSVS